MTNTVNVNDLMLDPLAGCLPIMKVHGQANNFIEAIALRLTVCMDRKRVLLLRDQLRKESNKIGIDKRSYIINELLHEFRKFTTKPGENYEKKVTEDWVAKIISKEGPDKGLDFYNQLKANRESRLVVTAK